jgi:hypothetical protein
MTGTAKHGMQGVTQLALERSSSQPTVRFHVSNGLRQ